MQLAQFATERSQLIVGKGSDDEEDGDVFIWHRVTNAEVDFVIPQEERIIPTEVKAGKSGTLKSLQVFTGTRDTSTCLRFDLNPPSQQMIKCSLSNIEAKRFNLISLPIYMAHRLDLCAATHLNA